ncbi:MAG TPA: [FeFe] hydrogenase H-cluster maturation GTPase HydF [Nitrospirota bacterium]|nr:[FeFe] hydrogenase H-cluster maturation GTPase HydF [Nitrospirota bacterium]
MQTASKGFRIHIGLFGRRNVGKSSLLNALTRQQVSIVSDIAGTTTDPVEKPMELQPVGPVLFIDTAGIDDVGALGGLRVEKTRQVFDRTDIAILVSEPNVWGEYENLLADEISRRGVPLIVVINKYDLMEAADITGRVPGQYRAVTIAVSAVTGFGLDLLRKTMRSQVPPECLQPPAILGDLVGAGEMAILVVPIDKEAPKGRLILPQVQSIRDLLDSDAFCMVVKERELRAAIACLKITPKLVVTDSQAFLKVAADVPRSIPLTSFSILFARYKGDLTKQVEGAMAIGRLKTGDRVLIAEACTHHPIGEDIGRVKIPRWLTQFVGGKIEFVHYQGHDFPEDLPTYKLVIHCGACTMNRREMINRIHRCNERGVPITNYGLAIAFSLGIFERALEPFPAALEVYRTARDRGEVS